MKTASTTIDTRAICLALLMALTGASTAFSSIIQPMSGNHRAVAESRPGIDETVNFAVYQRDGFAGDVFRTGLASFDSLFTRGNGSAALDTGAKYLYLYEVVNDGPGTDQMIEFAMHLPRNSVTSFGQWSGRLVDNVGRVSVSNAFGSDAARHTPAAPPNRSAS